MLLQPPHPRGMKKATAPAPRKRAPRRNSKVTVTYTEPRPTPSTERRQMSAELLLAYRNEGILNHADAVLLFHGGVEPSRIGVWTGAGVGREDYARMVLLTGEGVTPRQLKDYPQMWDHELASLIRAGIDADTAHAYGHEMALCCEFLPPPLPSLHIRPHRRVNTSNVRNRILPSNKWGHIIEWSRRGVPPSRIGELYRSVNGDCATVNMMVSYGVSVRILDHCRPHEIQATWRQWVEAANGHVNVAKAVCDAGGNLATVYAWIETGEPAERVALLARAGVNPHILDQLTVGELTEDDLEIWARLNEIS